MSFAEVIELFDYWHVEPPVHDLARWEAGYQYNTPKNPRQVTGKELDVAMSAVNGVTLTFDQLPEFVQKMLWEEKEKATNA